MPALTLSTNEPRGRGHLGIRFFADGWMGCARASPLATWEETPHCPPQTPLPGTEGHWVRHTIPCSTTLRQSRLHVGNRSRVAAFYNQQSSPSGGSASCELYFQDAFWTRNTAKRPPMLATTQYRKRLSRLKNWLFPLVAGSSVTSLARKKSGVQISSPPPSKSPLAWAFRSELLFCRPSATKPWQLPWRRLPAGP